MERLSSLDAVFLAVEDPRNQMNIGTVAVFPGPAPSLDEVRTFLAGRIARVPRCRQRVRTPHGWLGRPVWVDAVGFDLAEHVQALAIPAGRPFEVVVAEAVSAPLDRARPLWQVWVVPDLGEGRWALVAKVHHCMVDGIAGSDLLSAVLAEQPEASPPADLWPEPDPSTSAYAWFEVRSGLGTVLAHLRALVVVVTHPARSLRRARQTLGAAKRLWYRQHREATSLTGPIGSTRCWTHLSVPLASVVEVGEALGATVNDVVLAVVASGLRDLLVERGEPVEGRTITAMVPVSLRVPAERGQTGNRVANVHAVLPLGPADPVAVLEAVHAHLEDLKGSHEVDATSLLLRVGDFVPRVAADRIARTILRRQRNVETVITNVPGPRAPLLLGDRPMLAGYPVAPIAGRVRVTVAIWSYVDQLHLGITGDRGSTPDVDRLAVGIERGVAALVAASRQS